MALPGATLDIKWGADRCYCVGGKIFAFGGSGQEEPRYCLKVSNASFEQLIEEGVAEPARYLARAKWVLLKSAHVLPDDQLMIYLQRSHALIASKLTKRVRVELGITPQAVQR
jgi:predicted DNA-binding protein (MmcQ/YjbR family)